MLAVHERGHAERQKSAPNASSTARSIASSKTGKRGPDAVAMLTTALDNVKPVVEVKSRRVGGATYQVPVEVRAQRRQTLAMRWLNRSARDRSEVDGVPSRP
jgi:small subunit ribosomal protein S7